MKIAQIQMQQQKIHVSIISYSYQSHDQNIFQKGAATALQAKLDET